MLASNSCGLQAVADWVQEIAEFYAERNTVELEYELLLVGCKQDLCKDDAHTAIDESAALVCKTLDY